MPYTWATAPRSTAAEQFERAIFREIAALSEMDRNDEALFLLDELHRFREARKTNEGQDSAGSRQKKCLDAQSTSQAMNTPQTDLV